MSVLDELKIDFRGTALAIVKLSGTSPEYGDVVEIVDDDLEARNYDLGAFAQNELDEIYDHVVNLCAKAVVTIP